jgi:hypothetical protein
MSSGRFNCRRRSTGGIGWFDALRAAEEMGDREVVRFPPRPVTSLKAAISPPGNNVQLETIEAPSVESKSISAA